jgi:putative ABC transport system permease protein
MGSFVRDLRQGARQLIRRPAFSAAAIASLALGIGLNTTLFSVVNGVLLRDGPIARPERLVEIYTGLTNDFPQLTTSYLDYVDFRQGASALQGIAASAYVRGILSTGERPALVTGEVISSDYFDTLGVPLGAGRAFREDENAVPGAAPVVVISHGLWQSRFGARTDVVGASIELSGSVYTIVGVGRAGFTGTMPGIPTDFWAPLMMVDRFEFAGVQATSDEDPGATRLERRGTRWLFLKGRLADGRTIEEARTQIETIVARLRTAYPVTNEKATVSVLPAANIRFHPMLDGYVKAASAALLVAVSLVLLVACANVANMLLARGASRRRELAIRTAIGASRARIVRQLLSEGVVLAVAGGALGVLLAWWAGRVLAGLGTTVLPIPVSFDFSLDGTVLAFALGASIATALLFGVAPAWSASKLELVPALKASMEGNSRRKVTLSNVLVVAQLSLSLVLLVAGALLGRGFLAARGADLGYDPRPVSLLSFNLQMNGYDLERSAAFRDRALKALRALPGVVAVSTASRLPLAPDINMDSILVQGHHAPGDDGTLVDAAAVGAEYFDVVDVPILAGRAFTEDDLRQKRRVAIVNETFARKYWPDGSAVGRRIYSGTFTSAPYEIVGISRDHKVRSVGEDPRPYMQVPEAPRTQLNLIARTVTPAQAALPMFKQALWALEPDILFTSDATAENVAGTTVAPTRLGAIVLGAFGGLALLLAAVGLYGVVAHSVSRRTREVGIRIALGAERWQVVRMILGQGGRLALVGVALGALAAAGVARVLDSLLYGVSGLDPAAYGAAAGVLLLVALGANLVPAVAAARVDPIRALRNE